MRLWFLYTLWCLILILYCLKFKYFSVIDLKDAFYSVPLEESRFLFVFEEHTWPSSQLTWTVLPQRFYDSLHLFGQNLSWEFTKL